MGGLGGNGSDGGDRMGIDDGRADDEKSCCCRCTSYDEEGVLS